MREGVADSSDYRFQDPELLAQALTHRSSGATHNERLEFLGDALLGFIIGDILYRRFPDADEGQLTRCRAALVNKERLASIARAIELGPRLVLGEGEMKSGGWRRDSILANALEALLGAIYLDGGIEACHRQISIWFDAILANTDPGQTSKDPKTQLQEFLQARGLSLPVYRNVEMTGPPHNQTFTVECRADLLPEPVIARGRSRRRGEQEAAQKALDILRAKEDRDH
jgi:ribonuclease-3